METVKYIIGGVIVLAATVVGGFMYDGSSGISTSDVEKIVKKEVNDIDLGGLFETNQVVFENGLQEGSVLETWEYRTAKNGTNQASVRNLSGRDRFVTLARVSVIADGAGTITASSSYLIYVATSSSATISDDFSQPANTFFLINGPLIATSSNKNTFTSTTTDTGFGTLLWPDGEYIVMQLQEEFGCTSNGSCETATSSDRGFDLEFAFKWHRIGDRPLR